jgi:hypothetical protein
MLIAPTAVVALLLLVGLAAAVRRLRRTLAAERTARRLSEAQMYRDIAALTADALVWASAACVLRRAHRVLDEALGMYGPAPTHPDLRGDGDEQP